MGLRGLNVAAGTLGKGISGILNKEDLDTQQAMQRLLRKQDKQSDRNYSEQLFKDRSADRRKENVAVRDEGRDFARDQNRLQVLRDNPDDDNLQSLYEGDVDDVTWNKSVGEAKEKQDTVQGYLTRLQKNSTTLDSMRGFLGTDTEYDDRFKAVEEAASFGFDVKDEFTSLDILANRGKRRLADKGKYVEYLDPKTNVTTRDSVEGYREKFVKPIEDELEAMNDDEQTDYDEDRARPARLKAMSSSDRKAEEDKPSPGYIKTKYGTLARFEKIRRDLENEHQQHIERIYPSEALDKVWKIGSTTEQFMELKKAGKIDQAYIVGLKTGDQQTFNFMIKNGYDPYDLQKQLLREE